MTDVHSTVNEVLDSAAGVYRVALVHISRSVRRERTRLMQTLLISSARCLVPDPGAVISLFG